MATNQPSALVIDRDAGRGERVKTLLHDSGFVVVDCAQLSGALAAMSHRCFDLLVVAGEFGDDGDVVGAARRMRDRQPGAKLLLLAPAGTAPFSEDDDVRVVAPPFDGLRLGAALRALMAAEGAEPAGREAAELGVIEAQLACLFNRHAAAERRGATGLARDIAHQIGDAVAARQYLLQSRSIAPGTA